MKSAQNANTKTIPTFEDIFSLENLFLAWTEFRKGKKNKKDVVDFSVRLIHNLLKLRDDILSSSYRHGQYVHFKVYDPKERDIHKASVRDRVVHHAIYNALYPYFDSKFIYDSYSCRKGKGTRRAILCFEEYCQKESSGYEQRVWILKCDIKKCFASVDHTVLKAILLQHLSCQKTFAVVENIIDSFNFGIPLGNLTSQLFVNVYLNELDLYVKHRLKAKKYIRYADDFVFISKNRDSLVSTAHRVSDFLQTKLKVSLHEKKVFIKPLSHGLDFLGWMHFPRHRVLRTKTKRRMFRNIANNPKESVISSYLGLLQHGNGYGLQKEISNFVLS